MELGLNINAPEGAKIEKKLSTWAIFGIVVACLAVVILIAVAGYYCYKKRKRTIAMHSHKIGGGSSSKGTYKNAWQGKSGSDTALINQEDEITNDSRY